MQIFHEDLIVVERHKVKLLLNQPITVAFSILEQGFIQALLLNPAFHEGLSFVVTGNNPTCVSTLMQLWVQGGTVSPWKLWLFRQLQVFK